MSKSDAKEIFNVVKSHPFSFGSKRVGNGSKMTSVQCILEHEDGEGDDDDDGAKTGKTSLELTVNLSLPLFARRPLQNKGHITAQQRRDSGEEGLVSLKDKLLPASVISQSGPMEEELRRKEVMELVEGWRTYPFSLIAASAFLVSDRFSATLPLELSPEPDPSPQSKFNGDDVTDDDIEIDELLLPSSPPVDNKALKGLFWSRMGECGANMIKLRILRCLSPL
jgi:hypothetical protein